MRRRAILVAPVLENEMALRSVRPRGAALARPERGPEPPTNRFGITSGRRRGREAAGRAIAAGCSAVWTGFPQRSAARRLSAANEGRAVAIEQAGTVALSVILAGMAQGALRERAVMPHGSSGPPRRSGPAMVASGPLAAGCVQTIPPLCRLCRGPLAYCGQPLRGKPGQIF